MEPQFELQKLTYFTEGNVFTGSWSDKAGRLLRYRVAPDKENGQLLAAFWQEDKCFERAAGCTERNAPMSEEGLEQIRVWLGGAWKEITREP